MDPSSPYRPARIAGLTLLGVAGAAFVLGMISLFDHGGGNPQASSSSQTQSATPSSSAVRPPANSAPPATITAPPPASTTALPSPPPAASGSTNPPAVPPGSQGITSTPVRVLNNSTVKGLANRAADDLRADGWAVADVGNYAGGIIPTTTVYYRPGTAEEEAAKHLAERIQARYEPRFEGIRNFPDGVILVVTNDYKGPSADK